MLSDEQVGRLLAESAQCRRETLAMKEQLEQLAEKVDALLTARTRVDGMLTASRVIIGGLLSIVIALGSWLASKHIEYNDRISHNTATIERIARDEERHEVQPGHSGHGELAGEVRELRVQVTGLDGRLGEVQADVRELAHARRRVN